MKKIWKYTILPGTDSILMPKGATILHVDEQFNKVCLWVEIDPTPALPKIERFFEVFGTGQRIYEDMGVERNYLGTVKLEAGALIFHVYERF